MERYIGSIARYLVYGHQPGGFMIAVLENDLMGAFARADLQSRADMYEIVQMLYCYAPACAYGNPDLVAKCMEKPLGIDAIRNTSFNGCVEKLGYTLEEALKL